MRACTCTHAHTSDTRACVHAGTHKFVDVVCGCQCCEGKNRRLAGRGVWLSDHCAGTVQCCVCHGCARAVLAPLVVWLGSPCIFVYLCPPPRHLVYLVCKNLSRVVKAVVHVLPAMLLLRMMKNGLGFILSCLWLDPCTWGQYF